MPDETITAKEKVIDILFNEIEKLLSLTSTYEYVAHEVMRLETAGQDNEELKIAANNLTQDIKVNFNSLMFHIEAFDQRYLHVSDKDKKALKQFKEEILSTAVPDTTKLAQSIAIAYDTYLRMGIDE